MPHFGLGTEQYATWTSPIRKYGDLLNHRLIKSIIHSKYHADTVTEENAQQLKLQRDNQRLVERDIGNWLYVNYLSDCAESKQVFSATIFNINRAGFLAKLNDNGAVVFVPMSHIHPDRNACQCDSEAGTIKVDNEVRFKLKDQVNLIITQTNHEKRSITATIAETIS